MKPRKDNRHTSDIRPLTLTRNYLPHAEGSCYIELGNTKVLTVASVQQQVPPWLTGKGTGWVTAEYGMLPRATNTRNRRPVSAAQQNGRTMEIQRLIGRALRAVTDYKGMGENTIYIDCDVISADGGTRTASIIAAAVALHDACTWMLDNDIIDRHPMRELIAAISVGMLGDTVAVDLDYPEDSSADVDMNLVVTETGKLVEVQGTAEGDPFARETLDAMLDAAQPAIVKIIDIQKTTLGI
ncbi:ribonuclease PH [Candidatus Latescibacterota bacterium]